MLWQEYEYDSQNKKIHVFVHESNFANLAENNHNLQ